ncbi:MAG: polyphosphate polymerase domain-containing protein [Erysipelotrichaceae bacterium]|nr:polyphosphate polymerase domain-containing protein [Erysipelotrichaceae bacterium]MBR2701931.1 polyphosphate polymerase domain-containing protein [Erysipelotrichaceae bacterium]
MAETVFNRYEIKYLLSEQQYHFLMEKIDSYMEVDDYGLSTICNIYYDTDNSYLIRKSIEKPEYKEKLRLRSYGIPAMDSIVYLEIKKKYEKNVNKRRIALTLSQAYDYLEKGIRPSVDSQILNEIDYMIHRLSLKKKLYLAYDRIAYRMKNGDGFRMTVDHNIRSRKDNMGLEYGDYGDMLLKDDQYLLETKIPGVTPLWFTRILSEGGIIPVSFSKYGMIYRQSLNKNALLEVSNNMIQTENRGIVLC